MFWVKNYSVEILCHRLFVIVSCKQIRKVPTFIFCLVVSDLPTVETLSGTPCIEIVHCYSSSSQRGDRKSVSVSHFRLWWPWQPVKREGQSVIACLSMEQHQTRYTSSCHSNQLIKEYNDCEWPVVVVGYHFATPGRTEAKTTESSRSVSVSVSALQPRSSPVRRLQQAPEGRLVCKQRQS